MFVAMAGAVASYYLNLKISRFFLKKLFFLYIWFLFTDYVHTPKNTKFDVQMEIQLEKLHQSIANIEILESANNWELGAEREI